MNLGLPLLAVGWRRWGEQTIRDGRAAVRCGVYEPSAERQTVYNAMGVISSETQRAFWRVCSFIGKSHGRHFGQRLKPIIVTRYLCYYIEPPSRCVVEWTATWSCRVNMGTIFDSLPNCLRRVDISNVLIRDIVLRAATWPHVTAVFSVSVGAPNDMSVICKAIDRFYSEIIDRCPMSPVQLRYFRRRLIVKQFVLPISYHDALLKIFQYCVRSKRRRPSGSNSRAIERSW